MKILEMCITLEKEALEAGMVVPTFSSSIQEMESGRFL